MQSDQVDFSRQVRSALTSLYDPVALRRHPPCSTLLGDIRIEEAKAGSELRRRLLDAIASLKPAQEAQRDSRAWRRYKILELRYVEAKDAGEVRTQLAMSKSQFYREHELAVQSLAELLSTQQSDSTTATPPSSAYARESLTSLGSGNLPVQMTSLIGREKELEQIRLLLERSRLVTLTGVGGVGKTRLAVRIAELAREGFSDGVWFVELASVVDGAFAGTVVAHTLGVRELPSEPPLAALARTLRDRRLLLVLDNCEHLIDACVDVISLLLSTCQGVFVLATSRELLGLRAETIFRVPPLGLPDRHTPGSLGTVKDSGAVSLFLERARAAVPDFELTEQNAPVVAEICRKLDGLPLALELAASRVEFLALDELHSRLNESIRLLRSRDRTAPGRHQTLRATIEWSYGLLSDDERALFDRLSVFSGGWTLEAAEVVAEGDGIEPDNVIDLLGQLVDKSLVVADATSHEYARYRMLDSLRQFGSERVVARGDRDAVRSRHVEFLISLLERADIEIIGAAADWLERLTLEQDNLRSALRWLIDRNDATGAQRLAGAARRFWVYGGYASEGLRWLTEALELDSASAFVQPGPSFPLSDVMHQRLAVRARALGGLGGTAYIQGDLDADWRANLESLELWRKLGNEAGVARSLLQLGMVATDRGQFQLARTLLEEGITYRPSPGEQADPAVTAALLAEVSCQEGKYAEAADGCEKALATARATGSANGVICSLRTLGEVHRQQQDNELALARWEEGVATMRGAGGKLFVNACLTRMGRLAVDQGDPVRASDQLTESLRLSHELGDRLEMGRCLEVFAALAAALHEPRQALQLAGAAAAIREVIGAPILPTERTTLERALTAARQSLPKPAATRAWADGQRAPVDETFVTALQLAKNALAPNKRTQAP